MNGFAALSAALKGATANVKALNAEYAKAASTGALSTKDAKAGMTSAHGAARKTSTVADLMADETAELERKLGR